MSFSNTLDFSDIGRKLLKTHFAPPLNIIRITFKSFNNSGKHPCSIINKLKNIDRSKKTTPEAIFKKEDISSGPKNELFFNEEIILLIL